MTRLIFFCEGPPEDPAILHRAILPSESLKELSFTVDLTYGQRVKLFDKWINVPRLRDYLSLVNRFEDIDILYVLRTANLLTYGILVAAQRKQKIFIFDFDDATFLKFHPLNSHLRPILVKADAVVVGSHFLAEYARRFNNRVDILVSPVDTDLFRPPDLSNRGKITIGWLGSGGAHLRYLRVLVEPLLKLSKSYDFKFKLVSALGSRRVKDTFCRVEKHVEVDYGLPTWVPFEQIPSLIADFDVSVMPLTDDAWSRGKCGTKILESMSMGIPAVASSVGENVFLIEDGKNGFLARNTQEWVEKLSLLIEDSTLRRELGKAGRQSVLRRYSLPIYVNRLRQLFRALSS